MSSTTHGLGDLTVAKLRSIRARRRFKALVKLVIRNLFWLTIGDDEDLGENVQRNIRLLMRKNRHMKRSLTLQDIAILNKLPEKRSRAEKEHIYSVLGGLNLFKKYSPDVKKNLSAVARYLYYGPNRIVMRRDDEPWNMYFLLSGEISLYKDPMSSILKDAIGTQLATVSAGNFLGEVAFLYKVKRTATCVTKTHCELLSISKKHFEMYLQATIWEIWQTVMRAMARFRYFDNWSELNLRECCMISKLKHFRNEQVVLSESIGQTTHTFFVLKGRCKVIEHMLLRRYYDERGRKRYTLYKPQQVSPITSKTGEKTLECTFDEEKLKQWAQQHVNASQMEVREMKRNSIRLSVIRNSNNSAKVPDGAAVKNLPSDVEVKFMEVCEYGELAVFNIGESLKRRTIIAIGKVDCLAIPTQWLMMHNGDNTWTKVQQYLSYHVPTTEQLFLNYTRMCRWAEYKKEVVEEVISRRNIPLENSYSHVPYYVRLKDQINTFT